MEKLTALNVRPDYRGRLQVVPGKVPCVSLRLDAKIHTIDQARKFVRDWAGCKKDSQDA